LRDASLATFQNLDIKETLKFENRHGGLGVVDLLCEITISEPKDTY